MNKRKMAWAPIGDFKFYEQNPLVHSKAQLQAIGRSLQEFGWTNPVLVDKKMGVVAGHARLRAAAEIGIERAPYIRLDDLTPAQVKAYRIADNRLAEMAAWDEVALAAEVKALNEANYNLDFTGLNHDELQGLLGDVGTGAEEEAAPDKPKRPKSRIGDLYIMGDHRLVCGDATDEKAVALCFDGEAPNLMVTDPPYGVNYDAEWRSRTGMNQKPVARKQIQNDDRIDWQAAWALFPGGAAYVWHGGTAAGPVALSLAQAGFDIRAQIIWAKNNFAVSRGQYHWKHEPCWYAVRKGKKSGWTGSRRQSTLWEVEMVRSLEFKHPNQKPVECMRRPMINNSRPGDAVYDPFAGTGTSLIAAEASGRCAYLIELDPAWCDVIVQRWENRTGYTAERIRPGGKRAKAKARRKAK